MWRTDWLRRSPSFSVPLIFASTSSEAWTWLRETRSFDSLSAWATLADALVRASVADERRGDEPVARPGFVVPAQQKALVAVLAPLVHAAVRVADVRAPALPEPPACRVRVLEPLAGVDPPVLDFVCYGLRRPLHVGCDLGDRPPALEPVFDSFPLDYGHLCHVSLLFDADIPARRLAGPSCRAGEYTEFAELNEGHPLGDDSREKLSPPSIIHK